MIEIKEKFSLQSATDLSHLCCPLWVIYDPTKEECLFRCSYCYAINGDLPPLATPLANPEQFIESLANKRVEDRQPIRIGFYTDPFASEAVAKKALTFIKQLNRFEIPYVVMTKSSLVSNYLDLLKKDLATIQISITTLSPSLALRIESRASTPNERLLTIRKIIDSGYRCVARIDPMITSVRTLDTVTPCFTYDLIDQLHQAGCKKFIFGKLTGTTQKNLIGASLDELNLAIAYVKKRGSDVSYCPLGMRIQDANALFSSFHNHNCCHLHNIPPNTSLSTRMASAPLSARFFSFFIKKLYRTI